jgi:hypothetical protein
MKAAPLVAWIEGVGVRGPGLADWHTTQDVLTGRSAYEAAPTQLVAPALLPPAERRRVGKSVKLALQVALEAVTHSGRDATTLASVFTSSSGDGDNCDAICRALATDRLISPTRFHNSVHNAPAGYWSIAAQATAASTSLCAFDASFAAGLVDAMTQLACGTDAVLLVVYDAPYPEPLFASRPTPDSFGIALVMAREPSANAIACLEMASPSMVGSAPLTILGDEALETWRTTIPAARALPVLAAIARVIATAGTDPNGEEIVIEDMNDARLALTVRAVEALLVPPIEERVRCA